MSPPPRDAVPAEPRRAEPPVTELTRPFWDATREQRLLVQWCNGCDEPIFFPREVCPQCLSSDLGWRPSEGAGTVYAVSVQHRPAMAVLADRVPYAVVLVDLDDGIRIMSNVIGCDPNEVAIGQRVSVCWEPLTDGRQLPQFRSA
jgi:uncharacterized OB-fold protein